MKNQNENINRLGIDSKYEGKYVATATFNDKKIVASGDSPIIVLQKAIKAGFAEPVVFFVPENDTLFLY